MFKVTSIILIALALLTGTTGKPIPIEHVWDFEGEGGFGTPAPLHVPAHVVKSADIWYAKSDFQTTSDFQITEPDTNYKGTLTHGSVFDYRLIIGTLLGMYLMIFIIAVAVWGYDKYHAKKFQEIL